MTEITEDAVQIIARGPRDAAEAAAAAMDANPLLEGATYSILEEDEDRGVWRIDAFPVTREEADEIRSVLAGWAELTVSTEALADADWLAMSLSGLPPVREGRFFVFGLHDKGLAPPNAVQLRIEAGAAFGTGHHGTTAGCLRVFHDLLKGRRFPEGSRRGGRDRRAGHRGRADRFETRRRNGHRPTVRPHRRKNAAVNQAKARFVHASGLAHRRVAATAPYDLVFANILAPPLVALAQDIRTALKPGGVAILSGLLRTQERRVRAAYLARGFRLKRRLHRDAWATLVLQKG